MATLTKSQQFSLALTGTVLAALGTAHAAQALTFVTSRSALGANDSLDWSSLGGPGTTISNPFSVTSTGGSTVSVSIPSGNFFRYDQTNPGGLPWRGNFAPGDATLFTNFNAGPISLNFSNAVTGVGTQIMRNFYGSFTATIEAFDIGGNSLGSFSLLGDSNGNSDDSAIFIGVLSDSNNIARVNFNVNDAANQGGFAINQVSLQSSTTPIPTPALVPGAVALCAGLLRKRKAEAVEEASEA